MGTEARKERERVRAIEKEGSKLLQGYINYGKNAKKGLAAKVDKLKAEALTIKQKAETSKGMDPKLYDWRYQTDRHVFCLLRFCLIFSVYYSIRCLGQSQRSVAGAVGEHKS